MPEFIDVPVSRIFLHLQNPRHEPLETEAEVIERLCGKEDIYPLARDIVGKTVARGGRRDDVVVVVDGVGLQRRSRRVRARPDDEFGSLFRQTLPDFGKIDIETDSHADPAKVG